MGGVVSCARQFDQAQVAFDHHDLGLCRDAAETQPSRDLAFVHDAGPGKGRFFRVLDDQKAEALRIAEGTAHDERVRDRLDSIGKGDGASLRQQSHFG